MTQVIKILVLDPTMMISTIDLPIGLQNVRQSRSKMRDVLESIMEIKFKCQYKHYGCITPDKNYRYAVFYQSLDAESELVENKLAHPLAQLTAIHSYSKTNRLRQICYGMCYIIKTDYFDVPSDICLDTFIQDFNEQSDYLLTKSVNNQYRIKKSLSCTIL